MDTYFLEDSYKMFNNNEDELVPPLSLYDDDQVNNRKELVEKLEKLLDKNEVEYNIESDNKKDFIKATPSLVGERKLCISLLKFDDEARLCSYLNKELLPLGGHVKRDNYNTLFLSYDKSTITEGVISNIHTKIKDKLSSLGNGLRPMSGLEVSKKYNTLSNEDINEIKKDIKKISDETIKTLFTMIPVYLNDTKRLNDLEKVMKEDAIINEAGEEIAASIGLALLIWDNYAWGKEFIAEIQDLINGRDAVKGYEERQKQKKERTSAFFNKIARQALLLSKKDKPKKISKSEAKEYYNILSDNEEKLLKQELQQVANTVIKYYHKSNIEKNNMYRKYYDFDMNKIEKESYVEIVSKNTNKCEYSVCQYIVSAECRINDEDDIDEDSEEFKTVLNIHCDMEDICEKVQNYIKNSNLYFNIKCEFYAYKRHASILILFDTTFTPKTKESIEESDVLYLPNTMDDLQSLLDNTDSKHIYFTSDWHLLKNRYKSERNYVNCQDIVTWCRQNIKDDDIFMYLGDISYRWIDEKGKEESMKIMASLPGIKVLIAGNHDRMLGDDYLRGCGFKYIFDEYTWRNLVFTHRPINMSLYPEDYWNIHGHIHKWKKYNTTDGKKNINVYPYWFDNKPVTLDYLLKHKEELVKDNEYNPNDILSETKRSELPDNAFGIPEDRKYPLDTEQHVKSAIKLFGHAEESKKKKLAQNIRSAAKKYDITIPENTQCYKYLNEGSIESIIPEGITNVIFDMGGVLVNQNTLKALKDTIFADEHIVHMIDDFMCDEIFTIENKDVDRWYTDDMKNHIKKIAPEFVLKHLDAIFEAIPKGMYTYIYVNELLSILRNKGYNIYYLSNWPRWLYEIEKGFFAPLVSKFDGGLFSCESKYYMKPDKEFYQEFLRKFNLDPSTCLFFDDKYENISAAESVGMKACLFNDEETPKQLLGDNLNIPSDTNNTILVNMGAKLESVSLDKINWWHISPNPDNNHPDEELYYRNFDTCIQAITDDQLKDGPIERYVFTCNGDVGDLSCIPIGQILINPDRSSEWLIQYPLEYKDGLYQTVLNEWSMAACNPICGITKPFILKMTNGSGSLISTKQYALSPDLISDKYLVVNENAQLEIVNSNKFKDCFIEIYEFVGNKAYLDKINKAYNEGKIVDNTVFYTMLTGKPMLCEDQIDFDPSFRKIDLAYMKEDTLSKLATMRDNILETKKYNSLWSIAESSNVTINIPFMSKYNKHNDINLKEDFDGYYFYSSMTGKRSSSVKSIDLLTEAMIKTVL